MTNLDRNTLNTVVLSLSQEFVDHHHPEESGVVRTIWQRFVQLRNEEPGSSLLRGLPAIGPQEGDFATPFVIMVVTSVLSDVDIVAECPEVEQLQEAVRAAARALDVPRLLIEEMAESLGQRIHRTCTQICRAYVTHEPKASEETTELTPVTWWVEAWDGTEVDGDREMCRERQLLTNEVRNRFLAKQGQFVLFLDERRPKIQITKSTVDMREVPWRALQPLHKLFLGMVVQSFQTGKELTCLRTGRVLFEDRNADTRVWDKIRRVRSELDRLLHGVLSNVVVPKGGRSMSYEIEPVPYCWIRPSDGSSRLIH